MLLVGINPLTVLGTNKFQSSFSTFTSARNYFINGYLTDKNKNRYFNIGGVGKGISAEGNDFHAIEKGFISITPLTIDMTNSEVYNKIK